MAKGKIYSPTPIKMHRLGDEWINSLIYTYSSDPDNIYNLISGSGLLTDDLIHGYEFHSYCGKKESRQYIDAEIIPYLQSIAPHGTKFGQHKHNKLEYGYWQVPEDYVEIDDMSLIDTKREIEKWVKYMAHLCDVYGIDATITINTHHRHKRHANKKPIQIQIILLEKDQGGVIADWNHAKRTTINLELDDGR
jgi:hypothetical protein